MAKHFQILVFLVSSLPALACAELATVHLTDGTSTTVELVLVERGQIQWKNPANPAEAMKSFLRSKIEYVDFPPTGLWKSAEDDFQSGNIAAAIEGYQAVAASRDDHFYPMPGNFSSLALVRLLEIRRMQLDAKAVASQFGRVREEWTNLPPDYRKVDPVTAAWIATSEGKWEEVLGHLEKVESPDPETFYLRGRAAEALGRPEEAIQHYAGAYVLNFGGFAEVTKQSLRRSIDLLAKINDKERRAELQAQAKLYRDLFGKGKLWAEAPKWVVELAGAEIENAKANIDKTEMERPVGEEGTVVETASSSATLQDKEERGWLLASEIDRKAYVMNNASAAIENLGGVKETPDGYEFDGTGGGLRISGIDGRSKAWLFKVIFIPRDKDGALFDLNAGENGGIGFYLRDGKFVAVWNPKRGKATVVEVGAIALGKPNTLWVGVDETNKLRVSMGESGSATPGIDRRGLGLPANLAAVIGDTRSNDEDKFTADGKTYTPFKGSIRLFGLGFGADWPSLVEAEKAQFDGKSIELRPLEPKEAEPSAEEQKPATAEPETKSGEKQAE